MHVYPSPSPWWLWIWQICTGQFHMQFSGSQKHIKKQHHFSFICFHNSNVNNQKKFSLKANATKNREVLLDWIRVPEVTCHLWPYYRYSFSVCGIHKNMDHLFSACLDLLLIRRFTIRLCYYIKMLKSSQT